MKLKTVLYTIAASLLLTIGSASAEALKPFTKAAMNSTSSEVTTKMLAAGFERVGMYTPYDGATILVFTSDDLKRAAASSEYGGYGASLRVTLTDVDNNTQVSYTNPIYYGNAYRLNDIAALEKAQAAIEEALGNNGTFGTGDKQLSAEDLRKYHYMFGMEYFDDPSELADYNSYQEAVTAVEQSLSAGLGGASQVYRIDIPGKDETVFGVALTQGCSGDEYIMSRVDKDPTRSTGHLPYEILVSGDEVFALYARFRIAISWPHLPMIQSDTGATFFNIMCAPNAIEEALIQAAGGKV